MKELTEEFENQFACLGENTEEHISFSFTIQKEVTRIDKNGEELQKPSLTDHNLLTVKIYGKLIIKFCL